jgi:hypothetical protein
MEYLHHELDQYLVQVKYSLQYLIVQDYIENDHLYLKIDNDINNQHHNHPKLSNLGERK